MLPSQESSLFFISVFLIPAAFIIQFSWDYMSYYFSAEYAHILPCDLTNKWGKKVLSSVDMSF
jgi:hypothetical protein